MHTIKNIPYSYFGQNSLNLLSEYIKKSKFRRALIITDDFLFKSDICKSVGNLLSSINIEYAVYYNVFPNPTSEMIHECAESASSLEVDFLIALGGGSAIDTAKGAGILLTNGGNIEDYEGVNKSKNKSMPLVAINTTSGTGSEVTNFYIVTNTKTKTKMVMVDDNCMIDAAVNDSNMLKTMPKSLTAFTGMDAMTHSFEALLSEESNPFSDKDAIWAIEMINKYLPKAIKNKNDIESRDMMAYAQYSAGLAFSNSGLGLVHAMAHSLGGYYDLPHGMCNSILLPYILEFNSKSDRFKEKIDYFLDALKIDHKNLAFNDKRKKLIDRIKALSKELGIPEKFKKELIDIESIDYLADMALKDVCIGSNPIMPTKNEIKEIYYNSVEK